MSEFYTKSFEVSVHDVNINGIIRPSPLLRYCQETVHHQMRDCGPSYDELFDAGKSFILSRVVTEVYSDIHRYENIDIETWPCSGRGVNFLRCYRVRRGGEVVAQSLSSWALVDIETRRFCRTDEVDFSNYVHGESLGLPGMRFVLPQAELTQRDSRKVGYADIDRNRHMNNTNYPDILYECIPDIGKYKVTGMSISFVAEAPLGSVISICCTELIADGENYVCYVKTQADGHDNVCARFTLSKI